MVSRALPQRVLYPLGLAVTINNYYVFLRELFKTSKELTMKLTDAQMLDLVTKIYVQEIGHVHLTTEHNADTKDGIANIGNDAMQRTKLLVAVLLEECNLELPDEIVIDPIN